MFHKTHLQAVFHGLVSYSTAGVQAEFSPAASESDGQSSRSAERSGSETATEISELERQRQQLIRQLSSLQPDSSSPNVKVSCTIFDDGNGHAYFRKSPWVSSDILMTLRHGLGPAERGLEQRDDSPVWRFPRDYPAHSGKALTQTVDAVR